MNKDNLLIFKDGKPQPYEQEDRIEYGKLKEGDFLKWSTYDARKVLYHRRFFKLLATVLEHIPERINSYTDKETGLTGLRYPTVDSLLVELKLQMSLYDLHVTLGGKQIYVPRSIDFKNMGQVKFQKFVKEAQPIILKRFLPDISDEVFDKEFLQLMFD